MFNNYNDGTFKKVTKRTAQKLYNAGTTVYILPCKASVKSMWFSPYPININDVCNDGVDFQKLVNAFEFYNCNNETGKYTAFYVNA